VTLPQGAQLALLQLPHPEPPQLLGPALPFAAMWLQPAVVTGSSEMVSLVLEEPELTETVRLSLYSTVAAECPR
jgi:hypothetical protein